MFEIPGIRELKEMNDEIISRLDMLIILLEKLIDIEERR